MNATQTALIRSESPRAEQLLEQGRELIARARKEQTTGLYAQAETCIQSAIRAFEDLELLDRVAYAQDALANCYWRQGQTGKARTVLRVALAALPVECIAERVRLTNTLLIVESVDEHHTTVVKFSPAAISDAELLGDPYYLAQAHSVFAHALQFLNETDRAIENYTAATIYFEAAGHDEHRAATDANLAFLLVKVGRLTDARRYLNDAQRYYEPVGNKSALAQIYETRARSYEKSGQLDGALEAVETSIRYLASGDEKGLLDESRKTRDRIKAKMGLPNETAKPPWGSQGSRLRLVTKQGDDTSVAGGGNMVDADLFTVEIGEDDLSLTDLGPKFTPGSELLFMGADRAPDDVLALVRANGTGKHHIGYLLTNPNGSATLHFANSSPDNAHEPLSFKRRSDYQVVGVHRPNRR